jgi:hypothetical protein
MHATCCVSIYYPLITVSTQHYLTLFTFRYNGGIPPYKEARRRNAWGKTPHKKSDGHTRIFYIISQKLASGKQDGPTKNLTGTITSSTTTNINNFWKSLHNITYNYANNIYKVIRITIIVLWLNILIYLVCIDCIIYTFMHNFDINLDMYVRDKSALKLIKNKLTYILK